jgi:superfamily II DNA or RNA helicase
LLLDNENKNLKVHEWIEKYTEEGTMDIVTGYFTIGALAYLSRNVNERITQFRMVLGDIVSTSEQFDRPLDLLNENISIEAALNLSKTAKESVAFLKQEKVLARTLEPNFCHAKAYLHAAKNDERLNYYVTGSSNLTEAGVGLKITNNIELNIGDTGNDAQYKDLVSWFEELWEREQAHNKKTIILADGKKDKVDFKRYLISEIEKVFVEYTPRDIYYKILFELFGQELVADDNDPDFTRQLGRLENSVVYNALFSFAQKGVLSLIRMLQKYNGAILADAVGLGKTWSALAVMKFFQPDHELILLCPKKLEHNWNRFKKHQDSMFEKDGLEYFVRFHTDMFEDRLERYTDRGDKYFTNHKKKLIVIDESHNLRNDKSNRYKFFMEQILQQNDDVKVLLISATPINNSLNDIRNQFKMMVKGDVHGFDEKLGVRNLDYSFRAAQKAFNEWRKEPEPKIGDFIKELPDSFFKLTDSLIVARTRKMIEGQEAGLNFPVKEKPINLFVTPQQLGNFDSFEELFDHFPPMLSGYQPSFYLEDEKEKDILHDEKQRDRFLVKMMYILLVKRLESSWFSFFSTLVKIRDHHQNALDKIKAYQSGLVDQEMTESEGDAFPDDEDDDFGEFTLGKKRKIRLSDIDAAGKLEFFRSDLKKDLDSLDNLVVNVEKYKAKINKETIKPNNRKSVDNKLEELIAQIEAKRKKGANDGNQKVVIFTVYHDTAKYLFDQLKARGFDKIALVSGTGSRTSDSDEETKKFEPILERFAPYTKLFREKEWEFESDDYDKWVEWVAKGDPKTYDKVNNPIDILIATDVLSEGQNLQDADMVINYDIHWNPVRIIQRMGRIDRLGSPNKNVFGINFWPSDSINSYLNLQGRIEHRMTAMKLAGSEVHLHFSDSFKEMAENEDLETRLKARMLEQMQTTWDDIEVSDQGLGFDDLSLERYRQDLLAEFNLDKQKYQQMPKGIYSGFKSDATICPENGLIALLGYPTRPDKAKDHEYKVFELVYMNMKGELVLLNQKEVLDAVTHHKDYNRFIPDAVERGDSEAIEALSNSIKLFLESQAVEEEKQEDGTTKKVMGQEAKDILTKLSRGNRDAIKRVKENVTVSEKYQLKNFDLITWLNITV